MRQLFLYGLMLWTVIAQATLPCLNTPTPIFFTPGIGNRPLIAEIYHAKHSLQIATYTMTDQATLKALIAAHARGVQIQILLDAAPYQANQINLRAINALKQAGIPVKTAPRYFKNYHQKTLIVDHTRAYLMTGNFTYSGFHFQQNIMILLTNPALVSQIEAVYQADWAETPAHPTPGSLIFSPEDRGKTPLALINNAHTQLLIIAPGFGDTRFMRALTARADQGVQITLITRPHQSRAYRNLLKQLQAHHIHIIIQRQPELHAKLIIADQRIVFVGSNNFTSTSFDHNRELGILLCNSSVINALLHDFQATRPFHNS